jgi:hypothetical protein
VGSLKKLIDFMWRKTLSLAYVAEYVFTRARDPATGRILMRV